MKILYHAFVLPGLFYAMKLCGSDVETIRKQLNIRDSETVIDEGCVFVPHRLWPSKVIMVDGGYDIICGGVRKRVKNHNVDLLLRRLDRDRLLKFLDN